MNFLEIRGSLNVTKQNYKSLMLPAKQNLLKNLVSCIPNTVNYDDRFLGMKCDGKISVHRANNLASLDLNQIGVKLMVNIHN